MTAVISIMPMCIGKDLLHSVCRNEVYFSNRAATLTSLRRFPAAVADARKVIQLRPKWVKGYSRLAAAHFGNEDFSEVRQQPRPAAVRSCAALRYL